jgi:hypothetical protein
MVLSLSSIVKPHNKVLKTKAALFAGRHDIIKSFTTIHSSPWNHYGTLEREAAPLAFHDKLLITNTSFTKCPN